MDSTTWAAFIEDEVAFRECRGGLCDNCGERISCKIAERLWKTKKGVCQPSEMHKSLYTVFDPRQVTPLRLCRYALDLDATALGECR